jgi:hypothetical protein
VVHKKTVSLLLPLSGCSNLLNARQALTDMFPDEDWSLALRQDDVTRRGRPTPVAARPAPQNLSTVMVSPFRVV